MDQDDNPNKEVAKRTVDVFAGLWHVANIFAFYAKVLALTVGALILGAFLWSFLR